MDKAILPSDEGINLIHKSGCIAVLAHPGLVRDNGLVCELLKFSLEGVDVWHRKHSSKDSEQYFKLAKEAGLIMTGGSDFHNDEHLLGDFGYPC